MTSFSDLFDRHFQNNFLAHMLRDTAFLDRVADDVQPELFPDEAMSRLVRIVLDFYRSEHNAPDTLIFQVLDRDKNHGILTDDNHKAVSTLADELYGYQLQNRSFLLDEFSNFCRVQRYRAEIPQIHGLLEKGRLDDADAVLNRILSFRTDMSSRMGRFYSPEDMESRLERREKDDARRLWTLIPEMDAVVDGLRPGNIGLIQSRKSSDGKTAFLCYLARSFVFQAANVLIFTIGDMTEDEYDDRLDMCFAGMTRADLSNSGKIAEAQRRLAKLRGRLHVKEMPESKTRVSDLRKYAEKVESTHSFFADVVIVDYAGCLSPETPSLKSDRYAAGKEIFECLKEWVKEDRRRMWTAAQSQREAAKESYAEQHHVAGSVEQSRIVDLMVSIQRETQEETILKFTKTRHSAGANQTVSIPTDFSRMQFYDGRGRRES